MIRLRGQEVSDADEAPVEVNIPDPLPLDNEPKNAAELLACARASAEWRLCSVYLYNIIIKETGDADDSGLVKPFKPNMAQRKFLREIHYRYFVLKARYPLKFIK